MREHCLLRTGKATVSTIERTLYQANLKHKTRSTLHVCRSEATARMSDWQGNSVHYRENPCIRLNLKHKTRSTLHVCRSEATARMSDIKATPYTAQHVLDLFEAFRAEAGKALLFLKSVTSVAVHVRRSGAEQPQLLFKAALSVPSVSRYLVCAVVWSCLDVLVKSCVAWSSAFAELRRPSRPSCFSMLCRLSCLN